jgi:hypothetical protein
MRSIHSAALCLSFVVCTLDSQASEELSERVVRQELAKKGENPEYVSSIVSLEGYSFSWELSPSPAAKVIVISRNLSGELYIFDTSGNLVRRLNTGEIVSAQLCELDGGGSAEILLDEVDIRGTGILSRSVHIYTIHGLELPTSIPLTVYSRTFHSPEKADSYFSHVLGYVRCDPSNKTESGSSLAYLRIEDPTPSKKFQQQIILEFRDGMMTTVE